MAALLDYICSSSPHSPVPLELEEILIEEGGYLNTTSSVNKSSEIDSQLVKLNQQMAKSNLQLVNF